MRDCCGYLIANHSKPIRVLSGHTIESFTFPATYLSLEIMSSSLADWQDMPMKDLWRDEPRAKNSSPLLQHNEPSKEVNRDPVTQNHRVVHISAAVTKVLMGLESSDHSEAGAGRGPHGLLLRLSTAMSNQCLAYIPLLLEPLELLVFGTRHVGQMRCSTRSICNRHQVSSLERIGNPSGERNSKPKFFFFDSGLLHPWLTLRTNLGIHLVRILHSGHKMPYHFHNGQTLCTYISSKAFFLSDSYLRFHQQTNAWSKDPGSPNRHFCSY